MPVASAPRSDIQALRGLAVLLVIFQHAKAGFLPAGYLGIAAAAQIEQAIGHGLAP